MSRYEFARSGRDRSLLLLFPEGSFDSLPFEVRLAKPWTGKGYGELAALKPADRVQYQRLGYVMVREVMQQGYAVRAGEGAEDSSAAADPLRHAA
jgi:hypothetical protein